MRYFSACALLLLATLVITLTDLSRSMGVTKLADLLSIEVIQLEAYWSWLVAPGPYLGCLLAMSAVLVFKGGRSSHPSQRRKAIENLGRQSLSTLGRRSPET